jgi:CIC family chloride channel protein
MRNAEEVEQPADDPTQTAVRPAPAGGARWWRWFRRAAPVGTGFETERYLAKWLCISTAIGIVAGLGAIAFMGAIEWVTRVSLGGVVGYMPPSPIGEGNIALQPMARPWLLPLVTALGGLLSGIIVFWLAPEAEGHGTDAAIDAIHHKGGRIRARIPPIKLVASALTIGTGGSGGREGPTAQISAGFGSLLAQWIGLSVHERRIAVAVGMGAGIGAIFRAPLGGAVMAAEILYIHDLEVEAIIPGLIASIVGYSIYAARYGYAPIFGDQGAIGFTHPIELLYYAVLGVLCGIGGLLYERMFYGITALFHRLAWPRWVKPGAAGFLVGLLGIVLPGALHTGYGWVQIGMSQQLLTLPLWTVLLLPLAKILATSLSIGSGGSGGIFGPGMVIGGMLGASFWRLAHDVLPHMPADPAPVVIIGMMALFGSIAHAPLAMMLMVAEMTGNLSLLAPAMLAVAIATALVGDRTIYHSQLPTRADSPAHRLRFSFPLLSSLLVRDAMAPAAPGAAGADDGVRLDPEQSLDVALERLATAGVSSAMVVDGGRVVGGLQVRDVMRTYKANLERSVRRARALSPESTLFEARLDAASPLVGRTIREAGFPSDTLVVSITRDGDTLFPRATTQLVAGDALLVMADRRSEAALRQFLEGDQRTDARTE